MNSFMLTKPIFLDGKSDYEFVYDTVAIQRIINNSFKSNNKEVDMFELENLTISKTLGYYVPHYKIVNNLFRLFIKNSITIDEFSKMIEYSSEEEKENVIKFIKAKGGF